MGGFIICRSPKESVPDQILHDAQKMSELCGENWIQRTGVWVEAAKKLAVLAKNLERELTEKRAL